MNEESSYDDSISFCMANENKYPVIAPLAMDILSLPVSEASTERIFNLAMTMLEASATAHVLHWRGVCS